MDKLTILAADVRSRVTVLCGDTRAATALSGRAATRLSHRSRRRACACHADRGSGSTVPPRYTTGLEPPSPSPSPTRSRSTAARRTMRCTVVRASAGSTGTGTGVSMPSPRAPACTRPIRPLRPEAGTCRDIAGAVPRFVRLRPGPSLGRSVAAPGKADEGRRPSGANAADTWKQRMAAKRRNTTLVKRLAATWPRLIRRHSARQRRSLESSPSRLPEPWAATLARREVAQ